MYIRALNCNFGVGVFAMGAEDIKRLLVSAFPFGEVSVVDSRGDGDHWAVTVVSPDFAGKSRLQQHRMVYAALGGSAGLTLHSVQISTRQA